MNTSRRDRPSKYARGAMLKPLRRLALSGRARTTNPDCESRFSTLHCAHNPVRGQGSDLFRLSLLPTAVSCDALAVGAASSRERLPQARTSVRATNRRARKVVIELVR